MSLISAIDYTYAWHYSVIFKQYEENILGTRSNQLLDGNDKTSVSNALCEWNTWYMVAYGRQLKSWAPVPTIPIGTLSVCADLRNH